MRLNAEIEALKSFFLEQIFVVKESLEEKHQSVRNCNHVESLKEEIKYLRAENQMKTAIIKIMPEKENSLPQYLHSIIAPILESSKGNLKSNSPSKSDCSEVLSNEVKISKENSRDQLPTIQPKITDKEDLQILLYQLKVMILETPVETQIPKILKFLC